MEILRRYLSICLSKHSSKRLSDRLSGLLEGFEVDRSFKRFKVIDPLIHGAQTSHRLGLDTSELMRRASRGLIPVERNFERFVWQKRVAVSRVLLIALGGVLLRIFFSTALIPHDWEWILLVFWILALSAICSKTFAPQNVEREASPESLLHSVIGLITDGRSLLRSDPLYNSICESRRRQAYTGCDGVRDRQQIFERDFSRRTDELEKLLESSRAKYSLTELYVALVSFICLDVLPLMEWLEVDF